MPKIAANWEAVRDPDPSRRATTAVGVPEVCCRMTRLHEQQRGIGSACDRIGDLHHLPGERCEGRWEVACEGAEPITNGKQLRYVPSLLQANDPLVRRCVLVGSWLSVVSMGCQVQ